MARRCASAAILETLRDPKVVTMPAAAQTLWIRTVTAMQNSNISVLRFGSEIMNPTGIALFIQMAETEIETHLETVIGRGLLKYDADGALMCPMLVASISRAEINRNNGLKGGRPRKTPVPPGQTALMMPINGGKMVTEITEMVTENGAAAVSSSSLSSKTITIDETEFQAIGKAVLDELEIDPARSTMDYGLVRQWMADGADRAMILEVVRASKKPGIYTLKYFSAAIDRAIKAKPPAKPNYEREWEKAYQAWEICGRGMTPMPRLADFKERFAA